MANALKRNWRGTGYTFRDRISTEEAAVAAVFGRDAADTLRPDDPAGFDAIDVIGSIEEQFDVQHE